MEAWLGFFPAAALLDRKLDQQLKDEAGLTHVQYEVLSRLSEAPNRELRMTELAETLFTTQSGTTYQISQVEKAGYVRRREYRGGPRGVWAVLTDAGFEVLSQAAPGHVRAVRKLLIDVLTPDKHDAVASGLGRSGTASSAKANTLALPRRSADAPEARPWPASYAEV
jgi:DNA-binding MarR family transcriptional regulator